LEGGLNSQIWLFDTQGNFLQAITEDEVYTHGGLRWRTDGKQLMMIRLSLDSSLQQPEIILWEMQTGVRTLIVEDAAGAEWLP